MDSHEPKYLLLTSKEIEQKEAELKDEFGSGNLFFKKDFNKKILGGSDTVTVMVRDSERQHLYNYLVTFVCIDATFQNKKQENVLKVSLISDKLKGFREFCEKDLMR
jgi:hypothetical protein